ncbi:MAG: Gfo/Idh/MocA family oxidoreductase [Candidatus Marinimicrobia bacterium]|nr:Gfo/Idh/MocA family oxidoreductase [Candidatus Neomarinimicrobiota bacterium]
MAKNSDRVSGIADQTGFELEMKPIQLGIIGTGLAARKLHWPALKKLAAKFKIAMVCNHTEQKAQSFARLVGGVPYVLDYHDLLDNPQIEAVNIILPIELNHIVTRAALAAGKHVMVEKPLAYNLNEARKMLSFPEIYPDQIMMVAENFRYKSSLLRIAEIINKGEIGVLYSVLWNNLFMVDETNPYTKTQWRIDHKYRGGFITDGGVHNIAAIRDLFGDITWGQSLTHRINPALGEIDTFSFQFKTIRAVNGVLNIFLSAVGQSENKLIILGTTGSLVLEDNKITVQRSGQADRAETIEDDGGYEGEFADFHAAIRNGGKPISTFAEAYKDLETILSAIDGSLSPI